MKTRDQYLIQSVVHASRILAAFEPHSEPLRLQQLVESSGFTKPKTYRLLYTLEQCGFVERVGGKRYRATVQPQRSKKFKVGYAWPGEDYLFARDVNQSIQQASASAGVQLILADNRYNAKTALRNVDALIREGIDLAMEFQIDESVAPVIAAKYREAGIPLIAIEIPHPGATFYGANNYEAGLIGGRYLARWAKRFWNGEVDKIVMLELSRAGSLPAARISGMVAGLRETLRSRDTTAIVHLDGDGKFGTSAEVLRKHLRNSRAERTLVGAINDPSALGALHAFREAGRLEYCAIVGQNASPEAREELRRPGTRLVGSVGYFPERFGLDLLPLAIDILNKKYVPPAVFIKHRLIDAANVDRIYPNDSLPS